MEGRIYFKDSPYPMGHPLKEFEWTARLDPATGIWFNFHLKTESYYLEDDSSDPEDAEPESDWKAKTVWRNYHNCILSSTYWQDGGILMGTADKKLDFNALDGLAIVGDPLPRDENGDPDEYPPFGIYLLGHDDAADHRISFKKNDLGSFDLLWTGKIALTYAGDFQFKYEFRTEIKQVELQDLEAPESLSEDEVEDSLRKFSLHHESMNFDL